VAAPGWYNDESDRELARWHDGVGWTEHVVVKAEWEAAGHAPPPPEDRDPGRLRTVAGSAAVLALLLVGGVALAQDGGDDTPGGDGTVEQTNRSAGDTGELGSDMVDVTGFVDGSTSSTDASDDSDDSEDDDTSSSLARSGAPRPTAGTAAPGTVRRTETSTRTQTSSAPRTEIGGGDKTSVGNTSSKTISDGYVPPPSTTAPPTTTPTTTETTATTPSTDTSAPVGTDP
jgi:hypothetical protein